MEIRQIKLGKLFLFTFTLLYIVLGMLLHVEVSLLVVGKYPEITGDFVAREHSVEFSFIVLFFIAIYFFIKTLKGRRRLTTYIYWLLYLIILVFFYLYISLHQVEIIHLIQYAGVAILLGFCLDPTKEKFIFGKILFIGATLGIIDELLQYYIVSPGHTYLDFNDFLVNSLGVIAGVLFYYGFFNPSSIFNRPLKPFYRTKRFSFILIFFSLISIFSLQGNLQVSPPHNIKPGSYELIDNQIVVFMERRPGLLGSWQDHFVDGQYYVLTPLEGMILIFLISFLFSTFDPRVFKRFKDKLKIMTNIFSE